MIGKRWWFILLGAYVLAGALSYLIALAGEPQSMWLWRDVLGFLK